MDEPSSAPAQKPTQIPSWVMLGFVVGVLFVLALPRHHDALPPAVQEEARPPPPAPAPKISTIEAVFDQWQKYAVWDNDTTQVALWDSQEKAYSDCFEVLRVGDLFYFRSIPRLTHPVLTHGLPDDASLPLEFTETAAQRQDWLRETHAENLRILNRLLNGSSPAPARPQ